jgi:hypothetical protein
MGVTCRTQRRIRNSYKILVRKPEETVSKHRWQDNIKINLS